MSVSAYDIYRAQRNLMEATAGAIKTHPEGTPIQPEDQPTTMAHLMHESRVAMGHVRMHIEAAQDATSKASTDYNIHHAHNHIMDACDHLDKLMTGLTQYDPKIGAELEALQEATGKANGDEAS